MLSRVRLVNRAVLIADMVGSVRLIQRNEMGTISRWLAIVERVASSVISVHSGRLVKSLGDGFLLEFDSARDAVAAAFAIHTVVRDIERPVAPDDRIQLRIGIEVADILAGTEDVYGHGVNLAARYAQIANAEETVVSEAVREQITADIDADVEDLGLHDLKNVEQRTRAYRLRPSGSKHWTSRAPEFAGLLPTIAVVPLDCSNEGFEERVFGEVLADDLIERLSKSLSLNVISRLSTAHFRGRQIPVHQIFEYVNANYVLSGRYHIAVGRVAIYVELAESNQGAVIYADRREEQFDAVVNRRADLVEDIVQAVTARIMGVEVKRSRLFSIESLETHTLLLASITLMHRNTQSDFEFAHELIKELTFREARHPLPHAWLAHWHVLRVQQGWSADMARDGEEAGDHTKRALAIDPECEVALTTDGLVNTHFTNSFDTALDRYRAAVEANPNFSLAWLLKGTMHAFMDQGEIAVSDTGRALTLSPLDPQKYYYDSLSATASLSAGDNHRAIELCERSLRANSRHTSTLRVKLAAEWRLGRVEDAHRTAAKLRELEPEFTVSGWLRRSPSAEFELGREFAQTLRSVGVPD